MTELLESTLGPFSAALALAFSVVSLAELGDKSQLVCMALAARYRAGPVLTGAAAAFALLNLLAVLFGAMLASWLSATVLALLVAGLFAAFGIHALRSRDDGDADCDDVNRSSHGIFASTFLLIFLAEFGDKTQISVAGLSAAAPPLAIWIGATGGLLAVTALGVTAGSSLLRKLPVTVLHRICGTMFLLMAAFSLFSAIRGGFPF